MRLEEREQGKEVEGRTREGRGIGRSKDKEME
jgi:hypothetical protein